MLALWPLLPTNSWVAQCRSCGIVSSPCSIFSMVGCDLSVRLLRSSRLIRPSSSRSPFCTSMSIPLAVPLLSAMVGMRAVTSPLAPMFAIDSHFDIAPQLCLFHLANISQRHRRDYFKPFGPFVAGQPARGEKLAHRLQLKPGARLEGYERASAFSEQFIGHRHHGSGRHGVMSHQMGLYLFGANLFTATVDLVLDASHDHQVAGGIEANEIS